MHNLLLLQELSALLLKDDKEDFLDRVSVDPYVATVFALTRKKRLIIFEPSTNEVCSALLGTINSYLPDICRSWELVI